MKQRLAFVTIDNKPVLHFLLLLCCFFAWDHAAAQIKNEPAIIPRPAVITTQPGFFQLNAATKIGVPSGNAPARKLGELLSQAIKDQTGLLIPVAEKNGPASNTLFIDLGKPDSMGKEGYQLTVQNKSIVLRASESNGAFYGIQTLLQLLPSGQSALTTRPVPIPAVTIIDRPRFEWRGLMLDCGRYYYSMNFLKKLIDYMAMHKMNVFHWHLTEDHGWRLEIKKYPKLTDIGAWRTTTEFSQGRLNGTPTGGYYTQEQAKELVAYAAARYVTIVPEIEMPGHASAALVAYPELSCTGGPFKTLTRWGIQKEIFCAGNEKTFAFLEDVLKEVTAIFPGAVIHMGGDEAPKDRWKSCPKCQQRIRDEHLKDEHELQSYFVKRVEKIFTAQKRNYIGWDEILEGGLAPNAWVMSWRGIKGGIEAARQRHNVVMAPYDYYYLDYYQGKPSLEPNAIFDHAINTLEKVYGFEPCPQELTAEEARFIKGVQGNVWSEFIHTPEKVEYMTFPRAAAIAETGWTPKERKHWTDFARRMETQYQRYDGLNINYAKSAYNVWQTTVLDSVTNTAAISFKTNSYQPEIRYSTDGNEPTAQSTLYTGPFKVKAPVLIKSATFKNGKMISKVYEEAVLRK
ncbi:family 20 glycosylhydrolase [Niabella pedocola]|uniref:beta-N-acetylhexosaminidase n=1 Tax=Niabella pedocola TaxID=1752077 RepID=A0ABS8PPK9_9BACT|nr:family 20 glycosylhydrolase [Niabella pedocola]MCD2422267.1 family 20 glycosylhydrolase [Niabella pedocola]